MNKAPCSVLVVIPEDDLAELYNPLRDLYMQFFGTADLVFTFDQYLLGLEHCLNTYITQGAECVREAIVDLYEELYMHDFLPERMIQRLEEHTFNHGLKLAKHTHKVQLIATQKGLSYWINETSL